MIIFMFFLLIPYSGWSFDASPRCLWELETHFFDSGVVKESFDLFHVFQSQWSPIVSELQQNGQLVPKIVREKARKIRPNPLEHPFDPEVTKKILLETEYEIFRDTLINHYYYNVSETYSMFEYIRTHREDLVNSCLGIGLHKPIVKEKNGSEPTKRTLKIPL